MSLLRPDPVRSVIIREMSVQLTRSGVDLDPDSKSYGRLVGQTDMPHEGDEQHHFG